MYKTAQKHRLNRQQKLQIINNLTEIVSSSKVLILSNYTGLTVSQITELRRGLSKYNSKFKVVQNKLFEISLDKTPCRELKNFINRSIGIIYSDSEQYVQNVLKFIVDYEKQYDKFKILGGRVYDTIVDAKRIKEISELPSKEELIGKFVYLCSLPLRKLLISLKNPMVSLLNIIDRKSKS